MSRGILTSFLRRYGAFPGLRLYVAYRLARVLPRGRLVRVDVPDFAHPIFIRARTADPIVLKQALLERAFDFPFPLREGVFVDAGANIGITAALLATRHPRARVIAIELERSNFALMERNTRPYPNIVALHAALWSHVTRVRVRDEAASSWAFQAESASDVEPGVPAWTVDHLLERFAVDRLALLKIDIEGAEREVFSHGVERWIDRFDVLMVELHDSLAPGCSDALDRAVHGKSFTRSTQADYTVLRAGDSQVGS